MMVELMNPSFSLSVYLCYYRHCVVSWQSVYLIEETEPANTHHLPLITNFRTVWFNAIHVAINLFVSSKF